MKFGERGTMAAIVRQGDYLVFRSDRNGISVEYSPDAVQGAPIVGGFAARRGAIRYYDAKEASELVQNYSLGAEDTIIREIELSGASRKQKTLAERVLEAIQTFADNGYASAWTDPVWDGRLTDFHREFLYPVLGISYNQKLVSAVKNAAKAVYGLELGKIGQELFLKVNWEAVRKPQ